MDRSQNGRRVYHKFIIGLHTIIGLASPVFAEAPSNTNIAGPSASATGNVTNQAVQVLQGPFSVNTYGSGVSCQGPTLNLQTLDTIVYPITLTQHHIKIIHLMEASLRGSLYPLTGRFRNSVRQESELK